MSPSQRCLPTAQSPGMYRVPAGHRDRRRLFRLWVLLASLGCGPLPTASRADEPAVRPIAGVTLAECVEGLSVEPPQDRWRSAQLLGEFGPPATAALVHALQHDDPVVRTWAARGLRRRSAAWPEEKRRLALPALEAALRDTQPSVRIAAAGALLSHGSSATSLPKLTQELTSPLAAARIEAMSELAAAGPAARPVADAIAAAQDVAGYGDYVVRLAQRLQRQR